MDIFEFVCSFVITLCVAGLVALFATVWVDVTTNGMNDCIDSPEYCKTVQEYKQYWPEYQVPKEGLGK